MQIKYINKTPTPDEFNNLTEAVGGGRRDNKIVEEALNNTFVRVASASSLNNIHSFSKSLILNFNSSF